MDKSHPKPIAQAFEPILGKPAWQVKQGYGSFLTLEFGEPHLDIKGPVRRRGRMERIATVCGDWHLWIYCCGWDITQDGKHLANSESDIDTIRRATAWLDGQCLEKIWLEPGTVITHFEFDLGGVLKTYPYDEELNEQWYLYEPTGGVLGLRSDGLYSHGPGDTPPDEELWLPL